MRRFTSLILITLFLVLIVGFGVSYATPRPKVIIVNPRPGFKVSVSIPKQTYYVGENIKIYIRPTTNCYVSVYDIDTRGVPRLIFPNKYSPSNYLPANVTHVLPDKPTYSLKVGGPAGTEQILVIASKTPTIIPPALFEKAKRSLFPTVGANPSTLKSFIGKVVSVIPNNLWTVASVTFYVKERPHVTMLTVNTAPSGASVYLDGILRGQSPLTISTNPGTHSVKISLAGYKTMVVTVNLRSGERRSLSYTLQRVAQYGTLKVSSNPQGAKVYIDGTYRGVTPISISSLRAGTHEVKVIKSGYQAWRENVYVGPNDIARVYATLVPNPVGTITVNTVPSGASVYLDGILRGQSPVTFTADPGTHTLKLSLSNYKTKTITFTLNAGERRTFNYTLQKIVQYGSLKIRSNPQGARVYIDGTYKGTTPISISSIRAGTHQIRIKMSGYEEWVENVYVEANQRTDIYASLTPSIVYGDLVISSGVPGSKVFLNGTYKGKVDSNGKLTISDIIPGNYELTVIMDGYRTVVQDIYITGGEKTYIYLNQIAIEK